MSVKLEMRSDLQWNANGRSYAILTISSAFLINKFAKCKNG